MPDLQDDENDQHVVVNLVENAVVPDTKTEDARLPGERLHAKRTWGVLEGDQSFVEPLLKVLWKRQEGAFGGRLEDEAESCHLRELRLPADLLVGDRPRFFAGGPDGFQIEPVFEVFEKFQVFNGHERGNSFPVTFEHNPLAFERHSVECVGERSAPSLPVSHG